MPTDEEIVWLPDRIKEKEEAKNVCIFLGLMDHLELVRVCLERSGNVEGIARVEDYVFEWKKDAPVSDLVPQGDKS